MLHVPLEHFLATPGRPSRRRTLARAPRQRLAVFAGVRAKLKSDASARATARAWHRRRDYRLGVPPAARARHGSCPFRPRLRRGSLNEYADRRWSDRMAVAHWRDPRTSPGLLHCHAGDDSRSRELDRPRTVVTARRAADMSRCPVTTVRRASAGLPDASAGASSGAPRLSSCRARRSALGPGLCWRLRSASDPRPGARRSRSG